MEATCTYETFVEQLSFNELFEVKMVNNRKVINRLGFFTAEGNGYALFHPIKATYNIRESIYDDEEPGKIEALSKHQLMDILRPMVGKIQPIAYVDVDENTPCGWYFDTVARTFN